MLVVVGDEGKESEFGGVFFSSESLSSYCTEGRPRLFFLHVVHEGRPRRGRQ